MFCKLSKSLHKAGCYTRNGLRSLVPGEFWRARRRVLLNHYDNLSAFAQDEIDGRVAYYNRLVSHCSLPGCAESIADFQSKGKSSAYCGDFQHLIRHFPRQLQVNYRFGDLTEVPETPAFVKSRPIGHPAANANAMLLKLNSLRHYRFFRDATPFRDKKPMAVWRGKSNREHRIDFARRYMDHPLCDIGCTRHREKQAEPWHKPFMSETEQLGYRFIVSVEGIDVATNLKWIMASNSLCLMRRPRYETWFMEGTLVPGYHYVRLQDDHSDLPEKIDYYLRHPAEAEAIIANAQRHVARFLDPRREDLIGLLVMDQYFQLTGQSSSPPVSVGA